MNPSKWKHGGNVYEIERQYGISHRSVIDFSANINPLGCPPAIRQALIDGMEDLVHYPDPNYKDLIEALSQAKGVDESHLFPGNGAIESLYSIAEYLRAPKVHLMAPSFVEYERSFRRFGSAIEPILLKEENQFLLTLADVEPALGHPAEPIILCNPNNPTGSTIPRELMEIILKRTAEVGQPLILDEAFMEFIENEAQLSQMGRIAQYPHLFILRSMTKCYAMPGLRLGYLVTANEGYRQWAKEYRIPWMINHLAAQAGIVAVKDTEHLPKTREYVTTQRQFLQKGLSQFPQLTQFPAEANYLCFRADTPDMDLRESLIPHGILIRSCSNYIGLDERFFRIAVRNEADNQALLQALTKIFK